MIIGVCGGSGSGKTTLVEAAFNHLTADTICRVSQDSYYKNNDTLSFEERCQLNYDHPNAIDYDLFISQSKSCKKGSQFMHPSIRTVIICVQINS